MESFDRSLCPNDTISPLHRPPLQGYFCASQSAAVTKVKGGLRSFCIRFVSELFRRERPKLLYCLLPPPSLVRGEVEGGFSKATFVKSKPSEKSGLERGKKGGGQMSEETKQEEKPKEEPMGFKVTEEEMELALKKVLAGLYW